jgi:ATP/maltotriose-dependent transcriptional regulator MalT
MVEEMTTILRLLRGKMEESIRNGERALVLRERLGGHPYIDLDAALFLIIAHVAKGNFTAAEPLFDQLFLGVDQNSQPPPDLPVFLFYAGRARWLQGRLGEAHKFYEQMCNLMDKGMTLVDDENHICRIWMSSLLEMAQGNYKQAEEALRQAHVLEQKSYATSMHGNTRLMLARLYWLQNRHQEALVELAPVLDHHEQLGIPFPILVEGQSIVPLLWFAVEKGVYENYASYLLELLSVDEHPQPVDVPGTGATLTPREVEVLSLVAAGYRNRAIAEELVISEWTVKSHLTKVYRKLDVTSRTQAMDRAHNLGIR